MSDNNTLYNDKFFDDCRNFYIAGIPSWKEFVVNKLKATSIADFCCGRGDWIKPFEDLMPIWGCDSYNNLDKLNIKKENFRTIDFTTSDLSDLDVGKRDVVMSLEAIEHISYEFESKILDCMLSTEPRIVVLGIASGHGKYDPTQFTKDKDGNNIPGGIDWYPQGGMHHINCQPVNVVIEKMKNRGYIVDDELSNEFMNLKSIRQPQRLAFADFYHKNTRIYKKAREL